MPSGDIIAAQGDVNHLNLHQLLWVWFKLKLFFDFILAFARKSNQIFFKKKKDTSVSTSHPSNTPTASMNPTGFFWREWKGGFCGGFFCFWKNFIENVLQNLFPKSQTQFYHSPDPYSPNKCTKPPTPLPNFPAPKKFPQKAAQSQRTIWSGFLGAPWSYLSRKMKILIIKIIPPPEISGRASWMTKRSPFCTWTWGAWGFLSRGLRGRGSWMWGEF